MESGVTVLQNPPLSRSRVITHGAWLYDSVQPLVTFGQENRVNRSVAEKLAPRDGERILDIGCGTGLLTVEVARLMKDGTVLGVDASGPMIEIAKAKRGNGICGFELAAGEALPYKDSSFDGIVSALFFHHVPVELKRKCAHEIVRVLRPGGRVVIADIGRPWTLFGKFYAYSGWVLLKQPEIKENIDGHVPSVLREAGIKAVTEEKGWLGCIRVWQGRI